MISITTGRRLHFGLFTPVPVPELDLVFGGVGVMVDVPGITLQVEPATRWSVDGPQSGRVQQVLDELQRSLAELVSGPTPHRFQVTYAAPAHQGWGTGTQLALAVARLWCHLASVPWSARQAAQWTGRGLRSGVGIAGFDHPGALFDPGKHPNRPAAAYRVRALPLPSAWTWLLVEPRGELGLHAEAERLAFAKLPMPDPLQVVELKTLAVKLLLTGSRAEFDAFAEALTAYNRLAGSFYESIQGGIYGSSQTADRIAHLQSLGVKGVGQSSWGPGIFAVFPDEASAQAVKSRLELPNCSVYLGKTSCSSPRVDSSPAAR